MAISGLNTTLYCGTTDSSLTKLCDIKDVPDLISDPNLLDATTLSDPMQVNIFGINQADIKTFTANYTAADYEIVSKSGYDDSSDENAIKYYALKMGDGSGFTWSGMHQVGVSGFGVDEVVEMPINIIMRTKPKFIKNLVVNGS